MMLNRVVLCRKEILVDRGSTLKLKSEDWGVYGASLQRKIDWKLWILKRSVEARLEVEEAEIRG